MSPDIDEKDKAKAEKKRLKAQVKAEKARAKAGEPRRTEGVPASKPSEIKVLMPPAEKKPWHKDPNWVRAIVALATLIVMLATLLITIYL